MPTKLSQITAYKKVNEDYSDEESNEDYSDEESCINKDCSNEGCINKDRMVILCIGTVLLAILIILLYGAISQELRPHKPIEFIIADASITKFNLTSDNTLYYNFKLNITVRESNYFDYNRYPRLIKAIPSYKGNKFDVVDMEGFDLSFKNSIMLKPVVFYGNKFIKLDAQQLMEFHNETRLGIFNLDLKLDLKYNEYVYCLGLKVPLNSKEKLESTFNVTKCSREYQGWG
ncbi:NDR1/HIN1-like protein 3 [Vicia villosa]|uniref:NDR1/HIN1-like protein 3 n=1 Tax=Vicia villosa TaxID=3911 RepID=UPI00273B4DB8|nr:NDR1/HIN1-like protein 3 [Vicia villosa]